jgi:hypothetical protein
MGRASPVLLAFFAALALAGIVLGQFGTGPDGINRALRVTARFSFMLFFCAYAGGALVTLFGPRFQAIGRNARLFGLSFASAQSIHAGLVIWLYHISPEPPVPFSTLVFFGIGLFFAYSLALFSFRRFSQAIGSACWRALRFAGSEYISFAFLVDFAGRPFQRDAVTLLAYTPFVVLSVAGTFLRLAAWVSRHNPGLTRVQERAVRGSSGRTRDQGPA